MEPSMWSLDASVRRRDFIGLIGSAASAVAWPLAARAQQTIPIVGFLGTGSAETGLFALPQFGKA
jgi:putative ABC transport system substrate-binding protein